MFVVHLCTHPTLACTFTVQLKTCQKKNWFHLPTAILINNENSAGGNILVSELEANITNYIITPLHAHFDWFLFKFNVGYRRQMH